MFTYFTYLHHAISLNLAQANSIRIRDYIRILECGERQEFL